MDPPRKLVANNGDPVGGSPDAEHDGRQAGSKDLLSISNRNCETTPRASRSRSNDPSAKRSRVSIHAMPPFVKPQSRAMFSGYYHLWSESQSHKKRWRSSTRSWRDLSLILRDEEARQRAGHSRARSGSGAG